MKFNTKIFKGIVFLAKNNRGFLFFVLLLFVALTARAQSDGFIYKYSCEEDNVCIGFRQAVQLPGSNYLIAGYQGFMYNQIGLMKIDSLGNKIWLKTIPTELSIWVQGMKTIDNNKFIIYGNYSISEDSLLDPYHSDVGLVCVDSSGNKLWEKRYGAVPPTGNTYGYDYCEYIYNLKVANNRLYALGYSNSYNAGHFDQPWAFCTDFNGDTLWTWSFSDLPYAKNACMRDIVLDDNGDCIIVGDLADCESKGNSVIKGAIFKLDTGGNLLWYKLWAPICPTTFQSIDKLSNDMFVVCGTQATCPTDQFTDTCRYNIGILLKINGDGGVVNLKYILKGTDNELIPRFILVRDSLIFVIGDINWFEGSAENLFINSYSNNLSLINEKNYGNRNEGYYFSKFNEALNKTLLIAGWYNDSISNSTFILKTDSLLNCPLPQGWSFVRPNYLAKEIILYPNPATERSELYLENYCNTEYIEIFDLYGKSVLRVRTTGNRTSLDISGLAEGIYIVTDNNRSFQRKLIKAGY